MTETEKKLSDWLELNHDGYYNLPMKQIAEAAGTSIEAASRILPRLIARCDNVMPSEVKQRRFVKTQGRIDRDKLWECHSKGMSVTDIAYVLDCNEGTVRDILRKEIAPSDLANAAG